MNMTEAQTNNNSKDDTKKSFTTRKDVLSSIYSEEKTNELIRLFSSTGQKKQHVHEYSHLDSSSMSNNDNGGTINSNIYSVYHFYTGGKFMSAADSGNRSINAAFWILNAVRDACRDYLSFSSSSSLSASENHHYTNLLKVEEPQRPQDIYDSQFPSLSSNLNNQTSTNNNKKSAKVVELSSSSVKQKKNMMVKKPKRRIRPLVSPNNVTGATPKATGNIASLPSEDASSIRSIMLEHKPPSFPATRKKKTSSVHSNKKKITPSIIANNNDYKSKSILEEEQKEKTVKTIIEPTAVKENKQKNNNKQPQQVIYEPYKPQLEHLVRLYVAIIQNSLVPSTSIELNLLLCCLSVKSSATRPHPNNNNNSTSSTVVGSTGICFTEFIPLFNKGKIVSNFASSVLKELKPIIMSFDDQILEAMTTYAPLHLHLPEIISEIKTERDKRKKNEDIHEKSPSVRLNEESSTSFPIISASNNNMSVPFHTHRDSRLNYRSASQSKIYNNREECRDSFFARLRQFQASYTKLSSESTTTTTTNNNSNKSSSNTTTKLFLSQKLMPKNLYWFTEFFCDLLSKKGLEKIQETDAEILSFCKGNEKKLQKLHQRIMEAPIQAGRRNKKSSKTPHHSSQTTTSFFNKGITPHHHPDSYFHGNQEFFYDFIKSADSHLFAQQLMRQLAGKIHSTCVEMSQQVVKNNANNNNNTQRHAIHQQLKIQTLLAKFLGMLAFSPNWNLEESSSTAAENSLGSMTNVAYVSSSIAAVRHLDATCPVIPIQEYIISAYENKCLTVILPWIISFLQMIKWDIISQSSCYYKRVFQLLRSIQKKLNLFIFNNKENDTRHSSNQCYVTPLMIIFEIETFLSESIGLDKIEYLPLINIDELITDKNEKRFRSNEYYDASHLIPPMLHGIDDFLLPIKVLESQVSFFSSTGSQLTELYDLLMSDQLSQSDGKDDMVDSSSSSVITGNKTMISGSRKMRPSQVSVGSFSSSSTGLESSGDGNNTSSSSTTTSGGLKPLSSSSLKATYSSVPIFSLESEACYYYSNIQLKLVSSFFQHHPELHSISEFVMKSCMKKMYLSSIDGIMKPQIKLNTDQFVKDEFESMSKILQVRNNNGSGSGGDGQKKDTKVIDDHNDVWPRLVEKIKQDSLNAIEDFLETECRKCIPPAIQLLVPPSIAEQDVLDMAIELSVQHAKKEGTKMIKSIVYFEVEKHTHCYLSENRVEIESTIKSHKDKRDGGEAL